MNKKRKWSFRLTLLIVLILGFSLAGCVTHPPRSFYRRDLVGVWHGSYFANQGETGLTLTVWEENGNYRAIFHFYHLPGRTDTWIMPAGMEGRYYMNVTVPHRGFFKLVGTEWIHRPGDNWIFADLQGELFGDIFQGAVLGVGGDFRFVVFRQRD